MKRYIHALFAISILLSSCNMPDNDATQPDIATAAAMTVEAAVNEQAPLASPTVEAPAQEATPTYSQPYASFEDVTNCRQGPGVNYERITQIQPSDQVKIVGFFAPNYWIVSTDSGECWVAGEFVTPSGSYSAVPTVNTIPTLTTSQLDNVTIKSYDYDCDFQNNQATVNISWADRDGESGYRVVRNDEVVAELGANVTQYTETVTLLSGQSASYKIVAFTASATQSSSTITIGCQ